MRLNLGAGQDIREGFINVDIRPFEGIDAVADIRSLPFPNESVDEILAQDVLEHLPIRDIRPTLHEWARVLKPAGKLTIRIPHLLKIFRKAISGALRPDVVIELIYGEQMYGGEDHQANYHKSGLLEPQISDFLTEAGFTVDDFEDIKDQHNLLITAHK